MPKYLARWCTSQSTPEIVLAAVDPVFDFLVGQGTGIALGMPRLQVGKDEFVEFIRVDGIG